MYVDGVFKAALTAPQDFFQVDGGKPIYADGPIVLCDRADHMPGRTFDGKIAQLTIFDAALTENNVRFYNTLSRNFALPISSICTVGRMHMPPCCLSDSQ